MSNPIIGTSNNIVGYGHYHSSRLYVSSLIEKPFPPKTIKSKIELEMELSKLRSNRRVVNPIFELDV
jgi:hypothetical protein